MISCHSSPPVSAARTPEELARRLTPPYDVIDPVMQQSFYDADPLQHRSRVDLGKDLPGDNEFENRYTRGGSLWQEWKKNGTLAEEPKKSFYVYEQEYKLPDGTAIRRRGFFAAVRLEDFSEGGIRAHEHTFAGPKADRFRLMRATNSNLSPIFCLYDDPERKTDRLLAEALEGQKPVTAEFDGQTHRLWVISKSSTVKELVDAFGGKTLFIADGHHRYETSLLYRDEMRQAMGRKNGRQPFDYAMMYLNNIHDDGLVILPTHRILCKETCLGVDTDEALEDLSENFDMEPVKLNADALEEEALRLTHMLAKAGKTHPAFILLLPKGRVYLLKLKPQVDVDELIDEDDTPRPIKELDVSILHRYIINRAWLGNPEIELDDQDVHYIKDAAEVLRRMMTCKYGVGFLLNPTRIEQVCSIAQGGLRMPHKSTYFYPKLVTGLVMRDLNSPW